MGNIRRLNRDGESLEGLKAAYLAGSDLEGTDLSDTLLGVVAGLVDSDNGQHPTLTDASLRAADLFGLRHAEAY